MSSSHSPLQKKFRNITNFTKIAKKQLSKELTQQNSAGVRNLHGQR